MLRDRISDFIQLPQSKTLGPTEALTTEIIDLLKRLVVEHINDNYKAVIQVLTYPRETDGNVRLASQCLWNSHTDDVLLLEVQSETLNILVLIHGLVS